jgi:hypothetical protein
MRNWLVIAGIMGAASIASAATSTPSVPSVFQRQRSHRVIRRQVIHRAQNAGLGSVRAPTRGGDLCPTACPTRPGRCGARVCGSSTRSLKAGERAGDLRAAPDATPFACDANNAPTPDGPFSCYHVWVFDADASRSADPDPQRRPVRDLRRPAGRRDRHPPAVTHGPPRRRTITVPAWAAAIRAARDRRPGTPRYRGR